MGEKEPLGDESIIDGICDDCLTKYFPTIADMIQKLEITEQDRYANYKIEEAK